MSLPPPPRLKAAYRDPLIGQPMTSSSLMHNERSGGNISLVQIAASAAGSLNNRRRESGERDRKEASHSWLASKTVQSLGAIHSQGPEPSTWRLAKAGGRTERRRGLEG